MNENSQKLLNYANYLIGVRECAQAYYRILWLLQFTAIALEFACKGIIVTAEVEIRIKSLDKLCLCMSKHFYYRRNLDAYMYVIVQNM